MTPLFRPALLALPLIVALSPLALAQDAGNAEAVPPEETATLVIREGYDVDLETFQWTHRPVVVFADSPADPRFHEQMAELMADEPALLTRDVIVLTDTDPAARSALRQKLRPRGFMLVLIDKDGAVALRKPLPWSVRELSRTIDKMPMRIREVEERRGS